MWKPNKSRAEQHFAASHKKDDQVIKQKEKTQRERDERMARSEEHTSELQSLMRISYAVFCLKKKTKKHKDKHNKETKKRYNTHGMQIKYNRYNTNNT